VLPATEGGLRSEGGMTYFCRLRAGGDWRWNGDMLPRGEKRDRGRPEVRADDGSGPGDQTAWAALTVDLPEPIADLRTGT
jgi:hypothetical protein